MTRRLPGLLLAALMPLSAQEPASPPVFVEVALDQSEAYVQQPVGVRIRIGHDAEFFRAFGVALFQQALDRPFHVAVPWLYAAEDRSVELLPPPPARAVERIAVGDRLAAAAVGESIERDGRRYAVLELQCRWLPLSPGRSQVAPVEVRYAYASGFSTDLLTGRQPLDRIDAAAHSAPLELSVLALPGPRPQRFSGAVGEFTVTARSAAAAVHVGESFAVEFEVRGAGNLERFAAPGPPELAGFHVDGVVERPAEAGVRRFALDVIALDDRARAVPPIPFVAFVPAQRDYVQLTAEPVPLVVHPLPAGAVLPPRIAALVDAVRQGRPAAASRWWLWLVAAVFLAAALRRGARLRRRRQVRAELEAALGGGADHAAAAYEQLLRLAGGGGTAEQGLSGLVQRQVPAALVERARAAHAALSAARFGGAPPPPAAVLALADELLRRVR